DDERLASGVGATIVVVDAVEGLGLVRTLVDRVDEGVAVAIGRGAAGAPRVGHRAGRNVGASVVGIGHAVVVVVRIGATVGILEAVHVLRLIGALVERVDD